MTIWLTWNYDLENPETLEYTEEDILVEYWQFWRDKMVEKYGEGHELITPENCIDDWIVINWAWRKENP